MQSQNRVDQQLGNYRLVKLLGRGGYSEVYLAENVHLGLQTAIKVLKARDLDDIEQEKFRSEAKLVTTLEHPRIIKVLDYGIEMAKQHDGSTPYIVMEYAPLGTLRHLYPRRTTMPLHKIALYTGQIADALQYAHDKNIIHQDVKPENMLVRKEDDAALSDFGIAVADMNTTNLELQQAAILQRNARGEQISIVGTTPYLAPERLHGHIQRASDQYSLAIVVYEWLTGKQPFVGTAVEVCRQHEQDPPPPLAGVYSYITPEVEKVVMKALAKAPADRYKSVRDFAVALDNAIHASQPAPRVEPSPFAPNTPSVNMPGKPYQPSPSPQSYPPLPASPMPARQPIGQPIGQQNTFANNTPSPVNRPPGLGPQTGGAANPPWQNGAGMGNLPGTGWQGGPLQQQGFGYTDYVAPTVINQPSGPTRTAAQQTKDFPTLLAEFAEDPATVTKEMFVGDRFFLQKQRTRNFYLIGMLANILSALIVLIVGGFPLGLILAIIGGALSVILFWRCSVSVKKAVAISFGIGVALWWGIVAILITPQNKPAFAFAAFLFTLLISSGIHIWYVNSRHQQ
jgi:serine/threonine protein kinase